PETDAAHRAGHLPPQPRRRQSRRKRRQRHRRESASLPRLRHISRHRKTHQTGIFHRKPTRRHQPAPGSQPVLFRLGHQKSRQRRRRSRRKTQASARRHGRHSPTPRNFAHPVFLPPSQTKRDSRKRSPRHRIQPHRNRKSQRKHLPLRRPQTAIPRKRHHLLRRFHRSRQPFSQKSFPPKHRRIDR